MRPCESCSSRRRLYGSRIAVSYAFSDQWMPVDGRIAHTALASGRPPGGLTGSASVDVIRHRAAQVRLRHVRDGGILHVPVGTIRALCEPGLRRTRVGAHSARCSQLFSSLAALRVCTPQAVAPRNSLRRNCRLTSGCARNSNRSSAGRAGYRSTSIRRSSEHICRIICHRDLSRGWKVDKRVRDTGPYVAAYLRGSWSANYYGTHAPVLVWYSPDMFAWLKANRNEPSATAEPAPFRTAQ